MCASSHHKRRLWHSLKWQFRRKDFFLCAWAFVHAFLLHQRQEYYTGLCAHILLSSSIPFSCVFPPCVPPLFPRLQLHCYKQSSHCALLLSRERDGGERMMQGVKTNEGEGGLKRNSDSETKTGVRRGLYCRSDASPVMWRQSPSWAQWDTCAWSQP